MKALPPRRTFFFSLLLLLLIIGAGRFGQLLAMDDKAPKLNIQGANEISFLTKTSKILNQKVIFAEPLQPTTDQNWQDKVQENLLDKDALTKKLVNQGFFRFDNVRPNAIAYVRANTYTNVLKERKPCNLGQQWQLFSTGYLESKGKNPEPTIFDEYVLSNGNSLPKGWQQIFSGTLLRFDQSALSKKRLKIRIDPILETAFVNTNLRANGSWWRWWDPFRKTEPKLPDTGSISSEKANINDGIIRLDAGLISQADFFNKTKQVTGFEMFANPKFVWPKLLFSGGDVNFKDVLTLIDLGCFGTVRILKEQKIIFLAPPTEVISLLGGDAFSPLEREVFEEVTKRAFDKRNIEISPLLKGTFKVPVSNLSDRAVREWLIPTLRYFPDDADKAVKLQQNPETTSSREFASKVADAWVQANKDSSLLSIPGFSMRIDAEFLTDTNQWLPFASQDVTFLATCRTG